VPDDGVAGAGGRGRGANLHRAQDFYPNINLNGLHARGTLAQGPDGTLYGVTTDGGAGAAGVVFRIQTNGTGFTVLKNFPLTDVTTGTNSDGANPQAGLLLSGSTLFGTTANGGSGGNGTVFSLNTNGTSFTVLKSFTVLDKNTSTNSDGANPAAALVLSNGVLYGTAQNGGAGAVGTIFRVNTNGTGFTNIYSFTGVNDGANPAADWYCPAARFTERRRTAAIRILGQCSASARMAPASTGCTVLAVRALTGLIPLPDWCCRAACFMERRSMETAMAFPMTGRCSG